MDGNANAIVGYTILTAPFYTPQMIQQADGVWGDTMAPYASAATDGSGNWSVSLPYPSATWPTIELWQISTTTATFAGVVPTAAGPISLHDLLTSPAFSSLGWGLVSPTSNPVLVTAIQGPAGVGGGGGGSPITYGTLAARPSAGTAGDQAVYCATDQTGYPIYQVESGAWHQIASTGGTPSGAAGGDLGGSYPNPTVGNLVHSTGRSLPDGTLSTNVPLLNVNDVFTGNVTAKALIASGLTGAVAASRYVGATASGAPTTGPFVIGDYVIDQTGNLWICTTAGTPGTWTQVAGASAGVSSLNSETGAVSIVAGANVTVTPVGSNITVAASAGSGAATYFLLSAYATLQAALTAMGSVNPAILVLDANKNLDTTTPLSKTIPSNVTTFSAGGILAVRTGETLTINGPMNAAPALQCFTCTGTGAVLFDAQSTPEVWAKWFGAKGDMGITQASGAGTDNTLPIQQAINSIPAGYTIPVCLGAGIYRVASTITVDATVSGGGHTNFVLKGLAAPQGGDQNNSSMIVWDGDAFHNMLEFHTEYGLIEGVFFSVANGKWCGCAVDITRQSSGPPNAPTLAAAAGGSLTASTTYYYAATHLGNVGESILGSSASVATTVSNKTINGSALTTLTGETGKSVYRSTDNITFFFLKTLAAGVTTFTDDGTVAVTGVRPPSRLINMVGLLPAPTITPVAGAITAAALYYAYTNYNGVEETSYGTASAVVALTAQQANVAGIAVGPPGTTQRWLYRSTNPGVTPWLLVTKIANNTATTYSDNATSVGTQQAPGIGGCVVTGDPICTVNTMRDCKISANGGLGHSGVLWNGVTVAYNSGANCEFNAWEGCQFEDNQLRGYSGVSFISGLGQSKQNIFSRCKFWGWTYQIYSLSGAFDTEYCDFTAVSATGAAIYVLKPTDSYTFLGTESEGCAQLISIPGGINITPVNIIGGRFAPNGILSAPSNPNEYINVAGAPLFLSGAEFDHVGVPNNDYWFRLYSSQSILWYSGFIDAVQMPGGWTDLVSTCPQGTNIRIIGVANCPDSDQIVTSTAVSYSVLNTDSTILVTASAKTITLPNPATMGAGRRFVLNTGVSVTGTIVASVAGNVQGAATDTTSLAAALTGADYWTDGTNWYCDYGSHIPAQITATTQAGTTYTLALADQGTVVELTSATAVTVTIPTHASVAFPVGTVIELLQYGAGQVTIAAAGGVTLRNPSSVTSRAQYSTISIRQRASDEWIIAGDVS